MSLAAGQMLTHYRVVESIGAGAMGEVYRAVDTRLEREVAIKVLPPHFAGEDERLRRFEREAKSLASLNHPCIAQIFGVDEQAGVYFLALELVPGETLQDKLARGPLALDEALDVARQVADGLEAAHEAGVIHRDLKPANIRVTPEGKVKLLDFGLAKPAIEARARASSTDSVLSTEEGRLLGTPTYMAPEQARGKPIDKRVDVWAFGCVLYECLTGRRAFEGDTLTDVFAAVIEREPDWSSLGPGVPTRVRQLLERCIAKDARRRLRDVGDARIEIEAIQSAAPSVDARATAPRSMWALVVAGLAGAVVGTCAFWLAFARQREGGDSAPRSSPRLAHVSVAIPGVTSRIFPRISPDGSCFVYEVEEPDSKGGTSSRLFLRRFDSPVAVRLPVEDRVTTLAFEPITGRSLVVFTTMPDTSHRRVLRVHLDQGAPRAVNIGFIEPVEDDDSSLCWTDSNVLVITRVSELLTRPLDGEHWSEVPIIHLDGGGTYGIRVSRALAGTNCVAGVTFEYGPQGFEPRALAIDVSTGEARVIAAGGHAAITADGKLLYARGESLYRADFDVQRLETVGSPRFLFDGLRTSESWQPAWFDVARDGTIVFAHGGRQGERRELVTVAEDGSVTPWTEQRRAYDWTLAVGRQSGFVTLAMLTSGGLVETWGSEVDGQHLRPLWQEPATDIVPGPIDDAAGYYYVMRISSDDPVAVWRARLNAPDERELCCTLGRDAPNAAAWSLTRDGRYLLVQSNAADPSQVLEVDLAGPLPAQPRVMFATDGRQDLYGYSPDGQWIAHAISDDGRRAVALRKVRADRSVGPVIPLATPGNAPALRAIWMNSTAADSPTLLIELEGGNRLVQVGVLPGEPVRFSTPRERTVVVGRELMSFASLPDGRVLCMLRGVEEREVGHIEVVFGGASMSRD